jgi:hypothetical protein
MASPYGALLQARSGSRKWQRVAATDIGQALPREKPQYGNEITVPLRSRLLGAGGRGRERVAGDRRKPTCGNCSPALARPSQFPSHSWAFSGRDRPLSSVVPGHARTRRLLNGQQQTWKACWGNPHEFESLILRQWPDQAGCQRSRSPARCFHSLCGLLAVHAGDAEHEGGRWSYFPGRVGG